MNSVVFLFLNRVPRPKFEGSLTDLKLSNHGEAKEFTTTKGVFCFLCVTTGWCVLFAEICNLKFRNVLIIVQVKPLGLSCEQRRFFFCCAHYPRFLKTDAMCLQDFVESLFFFFFYWSCLLHFSMVCFTTKTEAVKRLTVNHRAPMRTHMRNKETALSAGKREWPSHISLVEMGTVFLDQSQCDGEDYFRHTIENRSNANAGCNFFPEKSWSLFHRYSVVVYVGFKPKLPISAPSIIFQVC